MPFNRVMKTTQPSTAPKDDQTKPATFVAMGNTTQKHHPEHVGSEGTHLASPLQERTAGADHSAKAPYLPPAKGLNSSTTTEADGTIPDIPHERTPPPDAPEDMKPGARADRGLAAAEEAPPAPPARTKPGSFTSPIPTRKPAFVQPLIDGGKSVSVPGSTSAVGGAKAPDGRNGHGGTGNTEEAKKGRLHTHNTKDTRDTSEKAMRPAHGKGGSRAREAETEEDADGPSHKKKMMKKKIPKDKDAPKKPSTAFILFSIDRTKELKSQGTYNFKDAASIIGADWKELNAEAKDKYKRLAEIDKERYIAEMKHYVPTVKKRLASNEPAESRKATGNASKKGPREAPHKGPRVRGVSPQKHSQAPEPPAALATPEKTHLAEMELASDANLDPEAPRPKDKTFMHPTLFEVDDDIVWLPALLAELCGEEGNAEDLQAAGLFDESRKLASRSEHYVHAVVKDVIEPAKGSCVWKLTVEEPGVPSTYVLPHLTVPHCNVREHIVDKDLFDESLDTFKEQDHVCCVFQREGAGEAVRKDGTVIGEVWEGRITDIDKADGPVDSINVLWYEQGNNGLWYAGQVQLDNAVCPWECRPSSKHNLYMTKVPGAFTTMSRVMYAEDGSLSLDHAFAAKFKGDNPKDAMDFAYRCLTSMEATAPFLEPVPLSETAYHEAVEKPISFKCIYDKMQGDNYGDWNDFVADVSLLLENGMRANADDTLNFQFVRELTKEWAKVKDAVKDVVAPNSPPEN